MAYELRSPSRRILVLLDLSDRPTFKIDRDCAALFTPSPLGLRLRDTGDLANGLKVIEAAYSTTDQSHVIVAGKTRRVPDHYNELVVDLADTGGRAALQVIFRAYDDGVAFRYRVPARRDGASIEIEDELTRFHFPAGYRYWALKLDSFTTSHEGEFWPIRAAEIRDTDLIDPPLLCQTSTAAFALAEADLRDFAGAYFRGCDDGSLGVQIRLSPRPDDPGLAVRGNPGEAVQSPWRVIMIADHPGELIESNLIDCLNPPSAIEDVSWIKPGKYAWDWWNGGVVSGVTQHGMNDEVIRRFIDFAAETGLDYMLIDAGWYVSGPDGEGDPRSDVTRSITAIDLPELIDYGRQRDVGLLVWIHWRPLADQMDEALPLYQQLGLKGMKVDFMDRNDQEMVAFYHRLLAKAAQHRLLVDLHGAYPPTGLSRTWPNLLTQEGVMGAEYNKWSARVTATHNVTLPYTRMLLGPMVYTPGGFRHATHDAFEARNTLPMVQTTRGHALAMYVVYDSPLVSLADTPDAYAGAPGLEFLRVVPTTWDETRFLAGEVGEFIAVARRSGDQWFVGAMTNEVARAIGLPLSFLSEGQFTAAIYGDAEPTVLSVSAHNTIELDLTAGGGAAIQISLR